MSDFLTRQVQRLLGTASALQPIIAPRFAQGPTLRTNTSEDWLEHVESMIPLNGQRNSQRPQSLQPFDQESLPAPADSDVSALDEAPVDNLPALGPAPSTQLLPSDRPFPQLQAEGAPLERDAANESVASISQPRPPSEAVSSPPASRDTQALPSREGAREVFPSHQDTQAASSGEGQPEITTASPAGRQPVPGPENVGKGKLLLLT
jgi:hypothetical protein